MYISALVSLWIAFVGTRDAVRKIMEAQHARTQAR